MNNIKLIVNGKEFEPTTEDNPDNEGRHLIHLKHLGIDRGWWVST